METVTLNQLAAKFVDRPTRALSSLMSLMTASLANGLSLLGSQMVTRQAIDLLESAHQACYPSAFEGPRPLGPIAWFIPSTEGLEDGPEKTARLELKKRLEAEPPSFERLTDASLSPEVLKYLNGYLRLIRQALEDGSPEVLKHRTPTLGMQRFIETTGLPAKVVQGLIRQAPSVWVKLIRAQILKTPVEELGDVPFTLGPEAEEMTVTAYLAFIATFHVDFPLPLDLTSTPKGKDLAIQILKAWGLEAFASRPVTAYTFFKVLRFGQTPELLRLDFKPFVYHALTEWFDLPEAELDFKRCAVEVDAALHTAGINYAGAVAEILGRTLAGLTFEPAWLAKRLGRQAPSELGVEILKALNEPKNLGNLIQAWILHFKVRDRTWLKFIARLDFASLFKGLTALFEIYTGRVILEPMHPEWTRLIKILCYWLTFVPETLWDDLFETANLSVPETYTLLRALDLSYEPVNPDAKFEALRAGLLLGSTLLKPLALKSQAGTKVGIVDIGIDALEVVLRLLIVEPKSRRFIRIVKETVPMAGMYTDHLITMKDVTAMLETLLPPIDPDRLLLIVGHLACLAAT